MIPVLATGLFLTQGHKIASFFNKQPDGTVTIQKPGEDIKLSPVMIGALAVGAWFVFKK